MTTANQIEKRLEKVEYWQYIFTTIVIITIVAFTTVEIAALLYYSIFSQLSLIPFVMLIVIINMCYNIKEKVAFIIYTILLCIIFGLLLIHIQTITVYAPSTQNTTQFINYTIHYFNETAVNPSQYPTLLQHCYLSINNLTKCIDIMGLQNLTHSNYTILVK